MKLFKIIYLILVLFVSFFIVNISYAHESVNTSSFKKCITTTNYYNYNMVYKKCHINNSIIYKKHKHVNVKYYNK